MSLPIATRGFIAPFSSSTGGGSSDLRVPFVVRDLDGELLAGEDLSGAGVIQVSIHGAAFGNRAGVAPTEVGDGLYYYVPDSSEIGSPWIALKVEKSGVKTDIFRENVQTLSQTELDDQTTLIVNNLTTGLDAIAANVAAVAPEVWEELRADHVTAGTLGQGVVVSSLATAALTSIVSSLMSFSHRSGRTVLGWVRRTDALAHGKATGLRGLIARFFAPDGSTEEFRMSQDRTAGTRSVVDVSGSES